MARSDFSSESTEASVSGGGFGVSVGVSAGYAESAEKSLQQNSSSKSQTIIGRYTLPRCDLLMWPNELEPTTELAELLETVRRTKNINVLRRLQAEYGNLFCQRVTLGRRLMTTKTVQIDDKTSLEAEKSSFKLALGASVSGSYAGISASASVKHEKSEGSSKTEAVGGETLLATDPKAWRSSVSNHELWRIINALSPLVEILSQMPDYEAVQSWFAQAVPALNQYMTLDAGHQCKARLRVTAPGNSLMIMNNGSDASFYPGHDPANVVTPRLSSVDTENGKFWDRHSVVLSEPIFHPTTYRAPAILGYNISSVGDAPCGSKYNKEYAMTTWDVIAPFDEQWNSCDPPFMPFPEPTPNASTPQPSHMVVFRNAQGEFVPVMSDSDEYQYWRIISTIDDDTSSSWGPRHIQPGDNVRLCWDFSDQTTGWRDFTQDVFSRRQPCTPAGVKRPLFLKVPWPRFEDAGTPMGLIMSPDPAEISTKPVAVKAGINTGQSNFYRYAMQDLRLRIDPVFNGNRGDTDDYALKNVQEAGPVLRFGGFTLRLRADIFWFGIH